VAPQALGGDAQGTVELAGGVLPSDGHGELDDSLVGEVVAEAGEEVVVDVAVGEGDRVGVLESDALGFGVVGTRRVALEIEDLLVGSAQLAADRSVEVISEGAAVQHGDPPVDER
jgi:hypothetical protein